ELLQRIEHDRSGGLEQPSAAERKECVGSEGDASLRKMVRNMAGSVAWRLDDLDLLPGEFEVRALGYRFVDSRNLVCFCLRTDNLEAEALFQGQVCLDVV